MKKTIAQELMVEGRIAQQRECLLRLLQLRFGKLPAQIETTIEGSKSLAHLNAWTEATITAKKLSDIPFNAT